MSESQQQPLLRYSLYSTPLLLFVWEYIAKKYGSNLKPSVAMTQIATWTTDFFYGAGRLLARISSFYTYIEFRDLLDTVHDLVKPVLEIIVSPYHFINGYVNMATVYDHPYIVVLGSATLFVLISWLVYYMDWHNRSWRYFSS